MLNLTEIHDALLAGKGEPILEAMEFRAEAPRRPELYELAAEIRDEAAHADPLPRLTLALYRDYAESGDRASCERVYFAYRARLVSRALAALMDRRPEDIAALEEVMWQLCDEYTWCLPAHWYHAEWMGRTPDLGVDLFASETAHALAEIVGLLTDELTPAVRDRVVAEVRRRVLTPWFDDIRPQKWESWPNNWSAVCAGAAGMAALWLETDPLRLTGIIDRVQRAMGSFLSGFAEDGGCPEGVAYWVYGYGYYTYFAEALRARTGLDMLAGTEHVATFGAVADFGSGHCVSFSDGSETAFLPSGLLSRLHERLGVPIPELTGVPSLHADHCYRWAHLARNLLWTNGALLRREQPDRIDHLPDLGWVIARSTVDGGVRLVFAAKGGHNDEPHNHNDLGHFIVYAGGEQLLADLGAGIYDADYFGDKRYEALHTSAEGHSVPIVGGRTQAAGREYAAEVTGYEERPDGIRFDLDLTAAYDGAGRVARGFEWSLDGTLVLTDSFGQTGTTLVEQFISRIAPDLAVAGRAVWGGVHGVLTLEYDPAAFESTVDVIETHDHHLHPETVHRLRLTGSTANAHTFTFRFGPHR